MKVEVYLVEDSLL